KAMTNRPKKEKGRAKFPLAAYSNITTNAASPNTSLAAASGRTSRVGTEVFSTRPRGGSGGRLGFRWAQRRHRRPLHRRGGLVDLLGSDRRSSDARGLEGGEAADGPYPFEDLHRVRLPLLLDDLRGDRAEIPPVELHCRRLGNSRQTGALSERDPDLGHDSLLGIRHDSLLGHGNAL